jgi:hypothetical protein
MHKVRLVLFHDIRRRCAFGLSPNEIHLYMDRAQCEPRFKNQKHAAIRKKQGAD